MNYKMWLYHEDKPIYKEYRSEIQKWLNVFQPSYFITNNQDFTHDFITEYEWSRLAGDKERLRKIVRGYTYLQYEGKVVQYKEGMVDNDGETP
jgi:hypothetical protein